MRRTKIIPHLDNEELWKHYSECLNPKTKELWHLLWLVQVKGINATYASELMGYSHGWGWYWIKQYNEKGISAIILPKLRNPELAKKKVTEEMKAELLDYLETDVPDEIGGGLWSGPKVKQFMLYFYGVDISAKTGWKVLKECGYSVTTLRPRHKNTTKEERETFKKNNPSPKG